MIGANEHGKTNVLEAVACLTSRSLAKDHVNSKATAVLPPNVTFTLELTDGERKLLLAKISRLLTDAKAKLDGLSRDSQYAIESGKLTRQISLYETAKARYADTGVQTIAVSVNQSECRLSIGSVFWSVKPGQSTVDLIGSNLPEVRLLTATHDLADTVSEEDLDNRENLPFEGLLKLGGVWANREALFQDDLEAHALHVRAGRNITRKLRSIWTQGDQHTFRLSLSGPRLRVSIEDPTTLDSPSTRSLGFRSFLSFALSLYAETETFKPNGFVLLFDEPGMHLHPQGQKDLLRELRRLSKENQIVYSTHSPFLIDRNDPGSTRLVRKELRGKSRGTQIVHKPYGANWASVMSALGVTPSDGFFPPDKVLVVEGTSDRLYLSRYMALCSSRVRADLNYLHIVDADRRDEVQGTVRLYLNAGSHVVVLADADKGGDDFAKLLKSTAGKQKGRVVLIDVRALSKQSGPASIEDLLPVDEWFQAFSTYARNVLGFKGSLSKTDLLAASVGTTLGNGSGIYLTKLGVISRPERVSKTSIADLFCQLDLPIPSENSSIFRLCLEVTRALGIAAT